MGLAEDPEAEDFGFAILICRADRAAMSTDRFDQSARDGL
jgi:hypothetical protein